MIPNNKLDLIRIFFLAQSPPHPFEQNLNSKIFSKNFTDSTSCSRNPYSH